MAAERLQKVLAAAGIASRRACEAMIAAGRVTVDGRRAQVGDQVVPAAVRIEVDGVPVGAAAAPIHLALHKPVGVTSTVADRHADLTVLQLLPTALVADARLYPVGRLDRDSEGLLLLTNDGDWAERVLHPRYGVEREYAVGLPAWLGNDQRAALDEGVDLEEGRAVFGHPIRPASSVETQRLLALVEPPAEGLAWYRVVLRQGWKRQVRRMFAVVGAPIARLVRVRIGPVRIDDLPSGRHRRLRGHEIKALRAGTPQVPMPPAAVARAAAEAANAPGPRPSARKASGPPGARPGTRTPRKPAVKPEPRAPTPRPDGTVRAGRPDADARPGRPDAAARHPRGGADGPDSTLRRGRSAGDRPGPGGRGTSDRPIRETAEREGPSAGRGAGRPSSGPRPGSDRPPRPDLPPRPSRTVRPNAAARPDHADSGNHAAPAERADRSARPAKAPRSASRDRPALPRRGGDRPGPGGGPPRSR